MGDGDRSSGAAQATKLASWMLVLAIHLGWGLATWFHEALPAWILLPLGSGLIAWYSSFQHEAVHGHFAENRWLNDLIVYPPLYLWLPYPVYRRTHRAHHSFEILTEPRRDPESYYVDQASWMRLPKIARHVLTWHNTFAGRMLLGPFLTVGQFLVGEVEALLAGDRRHLAIWLWHLLAISLVLFWVIGVAGMSLIAYLGFFVIPGTSLMLVRSFAEHKALHTPFERTAIVEAGPFFSLLFLHNNLHFAHHRRPDLHWQALPAYYRENRDKLLEENGGLLYRGGYGEIVRRFLFRPVDQAAHPFF